MADCFQQKNVAGDMTIRIVIKNNKSTDISDKVCGLLIMALRDFAIGAMSVGGGYSVGKGILSVKNDYNREKFQIPKVDQRLILVKK